MGDLLSNLKWQANEGGKTLRADVFVACFFGLSELCHVRDASIRMTVLDLPWL
jgi:hypothetical protein